MIFCFLFIINKLAYFFFFIINAHPMCFIDHFFFFSPKLQFLINILFFFLIFITIRSTIPRYRIDLLIDFFWKYLIILTFLNILFLFFIN